MRKQSDEGVDYLYHGHTTLIGVHTKDTLQLTQHEQDDLHVVTPEDVFPEYFVIRVNEFDQLAVTPLRMSEEERRVYDHYLDTLVRDTDVMKTKLLEAEIQGHKKGMAEGLKEGKAQGMAQGMAQGKLSIFDRLFI